MSDLVIPVAFCKHCDETKPVVASDVELNTKETIFAIFCPSCSNVLNLDGPIEITYYDEDGLRDIGWSIKDED